MTQQLHAIIACEHVTGLVLVALLKRWKFGNRLQKPVGWVDKLTLKQHVRPQAARTIFLSDYNAEVFSTCFYIHLGLYFIIVS